MGADKSLLILLLFLVTFVKADVSCALKEYKVAHFNGTSWCIDCPSCPAGQELSPPCGSTISTNELSECKVCPIGFFSAVSDVWSCRTCGSCADEDQLILKNCTADSDILCAKQCKSNDSYYDNKGDCMPCSPCCGNDEDVRVKECEQKLGSRSDKICAFQSNYDRCKKPTTAHSSSLPSKTYSSSIGEPRQGNSSTSTGKSSTNMPQVTKILVKAHSASLTTIDPHDKLSTTDQSSNPLRDTIMALVLPAIIVILLVIFAVISIRLLLKHRCSNRKTVVFHKTSSSDGTGNLEQVKINDGKRTKVTSQSLQVTRKTDSTVKSNWKAKCRCSDTDQLLLSEKDTGASYGQGSYKHGQTGAKRLSSLLNHENELQEICSHLDKRMAGRDYASVATYYGVNHYKMEELKKHEKGPSWSLFEFLAAEYPKLTVDKFAVVVSEIAKRRDVAELLLKYIDDDSKW